MNDVNLVQIDDWNFLVRKPTGLGPFPVFVLIHGWTGDENSMWVFASRLPRQAVYITPRGIYPSTSGGFSWLPRHDETRPSIEEFSGVVDRLRSFLSPKNFQTANFSKLNLVGFSQGAGLALSYLLKFPTEIQALACLSGFMPVGGRRLVFPGLLSEKRVFIAHGARDELVSVSNAREAAEILDLAGATVTYCEDDVGHKLSASCFRGLEAFFQDLNEI